MGVLGMQTKLITWEFGMKEFDVLAEIEYRIISGDKASEHTPGTSDKIEIVNVQVSKVGIWTDDYYELSLCKHDLLLVSDLCKDYIEDNPMILEEILYAKK